MPAVLNRLLYERLRRAFGPVRVSQQGLRMVASDAEDIYRERDAPPQRHLEIIEDGEYYLTCCPFCNDTRFRLYVNHMYGQRADSGRRLNFLAVCFNEACLADPANRAAFRDKLALKDEDLEEVHVEKGRTAPAGLRLARWPGPCKALDVLPRQHHARLYVQARGFDPDRLARFYGVSYCQDSIYFLARHRLIVPVYWRGRLVGWQARHVGELNWKEAESRRELPPKYYSSPGLPRSSILANLDNAKQFHTGVLVEGWFDVFGFGPMAMPVFGNTVGARQIDLFAGVFGQPGRAGVILLDPEEYDVAATRRLRRLLQERMGGQLAHVRLPPGTDPGALDRAFLRDYVAEHAADQGVQVRYERIS